MPNLPKLIRPFASAAFCCLGLALPAAPGSQAIISNNSDQAYRLAFGGRDHGTLVTTTELADGTSRRTVEIAGFEQEIAIPARARVTLAFHRASPLNRRSGSLLQVGADPQEANPVLLEERETGAQLRVLGLGPFHQATESEVELRNPSPLVCSIL